MTERFRLTNGVETDRRKDGAVWLDASKGFDDPPGWYYQDGTKAPDEGGLSQHTLTNGAGTLRRDSDGAVWLDESKGFDEKPGWYKADGTPAGEVQALPQAAETQAPAKGFGNRLVRLATPFGTEDLVDRLTASSGAVDAEQARVAKVNAGNDRGLASQAGLAAGVGLADLGMVPGNAGEGAGAWLGDKLGPRGSAVAGAAGEQVLGATTPGNIAGSAVGFLGKKLHKTLTEAKEYYESRLPEAQRFVVVDPKTGAEGFNFDALLDPSFLVQSAGREVAPTVASMYLAAQTGGGAAPAAATKLTPLVRAARVIKATVTSPVAMMNASRMASGAYEDAKAAYTQAGLDEGQARAKAAEVAAVTGLFGLATGKIESDILEKILKPSTGNWLIRAAKGAVSGAPKEAVQETVESTGEALIAKGSYAPDMTGMQVAGQGIQGGVAGGFIGMGMGAGGRVAGGRDLAMEKAAASMDPNPSARKPIPASTVETIDPSTLTGQPLTGEDVRRQALEARREVQGSIRGARPFLPVATEAEVKQGMADASTAEVRGMMKAVAPKLIPESARQVQTPEPEPGIPASSVSVTDPSSLYQAAPEEVAAMQAERQAEAEGIRRNPVVHRNTARSYEQGIIQGFLAAKGEPAPSGPAFAPWGQAPAPQPQPKPKPQPAAQTAPPVTPAEGARPAAAPPAQRPAPVDPAKLREAEVKLVEARRELAAMGAPKRGRPTKERAELNARIEGLKADIKRLSLGENPEPAAPEVDRAYGELMAAAAQQESDLAYYRKVKKDFASDPEFVAQARAYVGAVDKAMQAAEMDHPELTRVTEAIEPRMSDAEKAVVASSAGQPEMNEQARRFLAARLMANERGGVPMGSIQLRAILGKYKNVREAYTPPAEKLDARALLKEVFRKGAARGTAAELESIREIIKLVAEEVRQQDSEANSKMRQQGGLEEMLAAAEAAGEKPDAAEPDKPQAKPEDEVEPAPAKDATPAKPAVKLVKKVEAGQVDARAAERGSVSVDFLTFPAALAIDILKAGAKTFSDFVRQAKARLGAKYDEFLKKVGGMKGLRGLFDEAVRVRPTESEESELKARATKADQMAAAEVRALRRDPAKWASIYRERQYTMGGRALITDEAVEMNTAVNQHPFIGGSENSGLLRSAVNGATELMEILSAAKEAELEAIPVPERGKKKVVFTFGAPGSGKSSLTSDIGGDKDVVMLREAPGMDVAYLARNANRFAKMGFQVEVYGAVVPLAVAADRAARRAPENKRAVSPFALADAFSEVISGLTDPNLMAQFDPGVKLYVNDGTGVLGEDVEWTSPEGMPSYVKRAGIDKDAHRAEAVAATLEAIRLDRAKFPADLVRYYASEAERVGDPSAHDFWKEWRDRHDDRGRGTDLGGPPAPEVDRPGGVQEVQGGQGAPDKRGPGADDLVPPVRGGAEGESARARVRGVAGEGQGATGEGEGQADRAGAPGGLRARDTVAQDRVDSEVASSIVEDVIGMIDGDVPAEAVAQEMQAKVEDGYASVAEVDATLKAVAAHADGKMAAVARKALVLFRRWAAAFMSELRKSGMADLSTAHSFDPIQNGVAVIKAAAKAVGAVLDPEESEDVLELNALKYQKRLKEELAARKFTPKGLEEQALAYYHSMTFGAKDAEGFPTAPMEILSGEAPKPAKDVNWAGDLHMALGSPSFVLERAGYGEVFPEANGPMTDWYLTLVQRFSVANQLADHLRSLVDGVKNNSSAIGDRMAPLMREFATADLELNSAFASKDQARIKKAEAAVDEITARRTKEIVKLSREFREVRIFMAVDQGFDQAGQELDPNRAGVDPAWTAIKGSLSDQEWRIAKRIAIAMGKAHLELKRRGIPTTDMPYIHRPNHRLLNRAPMFSRAWLEEGRIRRRMEGPQYFERQDGSGGLVVDVHRIKFRSREKGGLAWFPSLYASFESYVPMYARNITHRQFADRWTAWAKKYAAEYPRANKAVSEFISAEVHPKMNTQAERFINAALRLFYVKHIAFSISVGAKHAMKLVLDPIYVGGVRANLKGAAGVMAAAAGVAFAPWTGAVPPKVATMGDVLKAHLGARLLAQAADTGLDDPVAALGSKGKHLFEWLAHNPVNIVEAYDRGVTLFSTIAAEAAKNNGAPADIMRRAAFNALAVNFMGFDRGSVYRGVGRAMLPFMQAPTKLTEIPIELISGAIQEVRKLIKGEGSGAKIPERLRKTWKLTKYILVLGLLTGAGKALDADLKSWLFHPPTYATTVVKMIGSGLDMTSAPIKGSITETALPVVDEVIKDFSTLGPRAAAVKTALPDQVQRWLETDEYRQRRRIFGQTETERSVRRNLGLPEASEAEKLEQRKVRKEKRKRGRASDKFLRRLGME